MEEKSLNYLNLKKEVDNDICAVLIFLPTRKTRVYSALLVDIIESLSYK